MLDFNLTSEQQILVDTAKLFAKKRLAPGYRTRSIAGCIEREVILEMGTLGFLGVELPESYGGLGVDCLTSGLLLEQIAFGDFNVAYVNLLVSLCGQIIAHHAQPEVASEWLNAICAGEKIIAIALTEPNVGSDAAHLKLKAMQDGQEFVLSGEKTSISMATQADVAVVFARTNKDHAGARGISAFLVPMDLPGIVRTSSHDFGTHAVGRGSIFFLDVRIPRLLMLGEEGMGFIQVMQGFDYSRALIGLQCLAVARASLDETWRYVQERQAFGKPIVDFQGVSFPLAEAETYYQAARWLCLRTLWLKDQGLPHTADAAMCKWWAPKVACDIIQQCLLSHGHGGYSHDYPFAQRYADVFGLQIGDGTAQIMKMIIARQQILHS